jgi:predicted nucleic acid-binding protein
MPRNNGMIHYIETSVILSLILEDQFYEKALSIWEKDGAKVTSILTEIEGITVLRRYFEKDSSKKLPANWLSSKEKKLEQALEEMYVINLDREIRDTLRWKKQISGLRSLDAIHLATAVFVQKGANLSNLQIHTFDDRLEAASKKLR